MPHRPGCSGFHSSIDYRSRAKAGDLLRIGDQPAAYPATTKRYMYHMIATKDRADLRRSQHHCERQTAPQSSDLAASALGSV